MKQAISWFLVFMILFSSASLLREPAGSTEDWENPYIDVTQDLWSYQYITELNKAGVLPSSEKFQGQEEETRGNLVLYLYNMDQGVFKDRKKATRRRRKRPPTSPMSPRIPPTTTRCAGPTKTAWWAGPPRPPLPRSTP
ncbi:MAG: hypothetical protein ACLSF6_00970 [Evtepia gabavorous]